MQTEIFSGVPKRLKARLDEIIADGNDIVQVLPVKNGEFLVISKPVEVEPTPEA